MLEVLPEGAYARWRPYASPAAFTRVRQWILAACGVLAGAVTHLALDAFTHENARGVRLIPWLEEPIDIGSHHVGAVWLLQDGSSLIGLVVVAGFVLYGLRRGSEHPVGMRPLAPAERRAWVLIYVAAALMLSVGWFLWARPRRSSRSFTGTAGRLTSRWARCAVSPPRCCSPASPWTGVCARSNSAARADRRNP